MLTVITVCVVFVSLSARAQKKIKISARDIFPRRGRSLLGELVIGALGARRHGIAATEMHFRVAVRAIVRSATGGRSRLVDLFRHSPFLLFGSMLKERAYIRQKAFA